MTTKGAADRTGGARTGEVRATIGGAMADEMPPLARIIMTGTAAAVDRRDVAVARSILITALEALKERGARAGILVSPAGFIDVKRGSTWAGQAGWATPAADYETIAAIAEESARELASSEVLALAQARVAHLILGIDVWPTAEREPHGEVACHVDIASGAITAITGKTYPTTAQQGSLVRDGEVGGHVITLDGERLAVLVCHDLAAWSPRGNAVATGTRQRVWQAMQDAVASIRPTLAVHLPHTLDTPRTWGAAWSRFEARSGGELRSATSAIRHLDRRWKPLDSPPDERLLARTGRGQRAVDIIVTSQASRHGTRSTAR